MSTAYSKVIWTVGLMGLSAVALADTPKTAPPQEPIGFVAGGVIGGLAAGPVGAVIGAGVGTWLGQRVHRAGEAAKAEAQVAALEGDKSQLQTKTAALESAKSDLAETNRALTARLDQLSHSVEMAQSAKDDAARGDAAAHAAKLLDGLQGDVLFRTGSAEIAPEMAHGLEVLAGAVAKSPALQVRIDGYADPRGTVDSNLKLSEERANAVRDLFLAAGVDDGALEVNAYGKSQSVAADTDGYALERRVRLTLQAAGAAPVAETGTTPASVGTAPPADAAPLASTAQTSKRE
jgi:outer membrane protein OmpA-like peptidoglycan-associated protein